MTIQQCVPRQDGEAGVLVKVLPVGFDRTDKEINAAELEAGDHVVAMMRRPDFSIYDQIGKI